MKNANHTNIRGKHKSALVLVDVINAFDFDGASRLLRHAKPMARNLAQLRKRLKGIGVPVIYANDNFGQWQSDFPRIFEHVLKKTKGREIAQMLAPESDDYFVLKPKHSAFYLTPLELLLRESKINHIIIAGLQTNICVLLTAHDAHMRDFRITVPRDCSASESDADHLTALEHLRTCLRVSVIPSTSITKATLREGGRPRPPS